LREVHADVVVTIATMGIPLALLVSKALGHEHAVVLPKVPKIHLDGALQEPVHSITTAGKRPLLFESKREVVIDDVISTGASVAAALSLVRRSRGNAVADHARK
jgi:adenine phosphoribosyltransferase